MQYEVSIFNFIIGNITDSTDISVIWVYIDNLKFVILNMKTMNNSIVTYSIAAY